MLSHTTSKDASLHGMHIAQKSEVGQGHGTASGDLLPSIGTHRTTPQPRHRQGSLLVGKFCLKWDLRQKSQQVASSWTACPCRGKRVVQHRFLGQAVSVKEMFCNCQHPEGIYRKSHMDGKYREVRMHRNKFSVAHWSAVAEAPVDLLDAWLCKLSSPR